MSDGIELKLDASGVQSFAAAAILQQLGKDGSEAVLKQAIASILTPPKKSAYDPAPEAPIQTAFNQAVREATFQVAREVVAERPEFREAIAAQVNATINTLLATDPADPEADYRVAAFQRSIREALLEAFQAKADKPTY